MSERWLPVSGFEGLYEVSDAGAVRNARTGRVLHPRADRDGYQLVTLWRGKPTTQHDRKVHRVVLEAFVGPAASDRPVCDHANGKRDDNRLANLRWSSQSANLRNRHDPIRSASGVRGVRFREGKRTPWQAYGRLDGRFKSLGHFTTREAAIAARTAFHEAVTNG